MDRSTDGAAAMLETAVDVAQQTATREEPCAAADTSRSLGQRHVAQLVLLQVPQVQNCLPARDADVRFTGTVPTGLQFTGTVLAGIWFIGTVPTAGRFTSTLPTGLQFTSTVLAGIWFIGTVPKAGRFTGTVPTGLPFTSTVPAEVALGFGFRMKLVAASRTDKCRSTELNHRCSSYRNHIVPVSGEIINNNNNNNKR